MSGRAVLVPAGADYRSNWRFSQGLTCKRALHKQRLMSRYVRVGFASFGWGAAAFQSEEEIKLKSRHNKRSPRDE